MSKVPMSMGQEIGILVVKETTSFLSILGSILIVTCIYRQRQKRPIAQDTLLHLLLGLSISDFIASVVTFMGSFMVPEGAIHDLPWFVGNQATCRASAFGQTWSTLSAASYNGFIAIYFWRSIRKTSKRMSASTNQSQDRCFRIAAHLISILSGGVVAIMALVGEWYRPHPFLGVCYFSVKGSHTAMIVGRTRLAYKWFVTLVAIVCTIALARKVRANLQKSARHASSWTTSTRSTLNASNSDLTTAAPNTTAPPSERRLSMARAGSSVLRLTGEASPTGRCEKERQVLRQSCWYLLAYLNTFLPPFILWICLQVDKTITKRRGEPGVYTLLLFWWFATPIQGLLNFGVFIRPRFVAWKTHFQKEITRQETTPFELMDDEQAAAIAEMPSWWYILYLAVLEDAPSSQSKRFQRWKASSMKAIVECSSGSGKKNSRSRTDRTSQVDITGKEESHNSSATSATNQSVLSHGGGSVPPLDYSPAPGSTADKQADDKNSSPMETTAYEPVATMEEVETTEEREEELVDAGGGEDDCATRNTLEVGHA